jgi:hypothetical protein
MNVGKQGDAAPAISLVYTNGNKQNAVNDSAL